MSKIWNFLTQGVTYLLPKNKHTGDPGQYRPITCLSTTYNNKAKTLAPTDIILRHDTISRTVHQQLALKYV